METQSHIHEGHEAEESFSPRGALTFFIGLIVMYTVLWFSLYVELLNRR